jgi:hypothetical protein
MLSRTIGEDMVILMEKRKGGPSVHLLVRLPPWPPDTNTEHFREVWRGACFLEKGHQHLITPQGERRVFLRGASAKRPLEWCCTCLGDVNKIIKKAGWPGPHIDQTLIDAELPGLTRLLHQLAES